jgi:predicted glycosyltransferase
VNLVHHSQHILGVGHFFRSLEIDLALLDRGHHLLLITGGPQPPAKPPMGIEHIPLPGLRMDKDFKELFAVSSDRSSEDILSERRERILDVVAGETSAPCDVFLVELFPFGRKRFGPELLPALEAVRKAGGYCVCSLRDILVEKEDQAKFERRALSLLNDHFDALLVHADPAIIPLSETFSRTADIRVPLVYSGWVAQGPQEGARSIKRRALNLPDEDTLMTAAVGGGSIGHELLLAAIAASQRLHEQLPHRLVVSTGPYMPDDQAEAVHAAAADSPWIEVHRFIEDYVDLLAAADLSLSMGGYNTTMSLVASGTFGLLYPFGQNREQGMRARKLQEHGLLAVLDEAELEPAILAERMKEALSRPRPESAETLRVTAELHMDGARVTAELLERLHLGGPEALRSFSLEEAS